MSSPLREMRTCVPARTTSGMVLSKLGLMLASTVLWKLSVTVLAPVTKVCVCASAVHGADAGSLAHGVG